VNPEEFDILRDERARQLHRQHADAKRKAVAEVLSVPRTDRARSLDEFLAKYPRQRHVLDSYLARVWGTREWPWHLEKLKANRPELFR